MSACCPSDVKVVTSVTGTTVTTTYLDMSVSPPALIDQAAFDALTLVNCPSVETDKEKVCLQVIGNTDAALIVGGWQICSITTTFADTDGTVDSLVISDSILVLTDGTDVTATHEVVDCPEAIVFEESYCVGGAGEKKVAAEVTK